MPPASNPLDIWYPNGFTEAVQVYIWDGSKPILWDGSVTFSGSLPSTVAGNLTNNNAAPTNNNLGALVAVANSSAPTWTEGKQVLLSVDTGGSLRVSATISTAGLATSANQTNASQKTQVVDGSGNVIGSHSSALDVSIRSQAAALTVDGSAVTQPVSLITTGKTLKVATFSTNSATDIVAAVTSKRLKVFAYKLMTVYSAGSITPKFYSNGTGGTLLDQSLLQAPSAVVVGVTEQVAVPSFLFATNAGEKLTFDPNGQTVVGRVSYWDDDAT